jgi:acyl carrier protein
MMDSSRAQDSDVTTIVVDRFQQYLGTSDDLPLSSRLLADLGVDSIAFVTILLDLADALELDLRAAQVNVSTIQTLEDVVALVHTLQGGGPVTG